VNKNEIYDIEIRDMSVDGAGIGTVNGMAVFVSGMITGEKGRVKIIKAKKRYAVGRVEEITQPSPARQTPECAYFPRCGGCMYMHMSYEAELAQKRGYVENCFRRIGGIDHEVLPVLGAENVHGYRNKAAFPVRATEAGNVTGSFKRRSHDVIPIERCLLHHEAMDEVLAAARRWMEKEHISAYDETTLKGAVRHIVVRRTSLGEIMAGVVLNENIDEKPLIEELKKVAGIKSIVLNFNRENTNTIMGDKTRTVWGEDTVTEDLLGLKFEVSLKSFMQVNHDQCEKLYTRALTAAEIGEKDTVADLYCGMGTMTLMAARKAKRVVGVEVVPEAVANARANAVRNGIANAEFILGDAHEVFCERRDIDVIITDPPRAGMSEEVTEDIIASSAKKLVYVSCDPATLARDAARLIEAGFNIKFIQPVDMFPRTGGIETVCCFER